MQSVGRALDLLEALGTSSIAGVTELASTTGLPYATIHRLLSTLVSRGYVRHDPVARKYTLGSQLMRLGKSANQLIDAWVRPHLEELVAISKETANFAVLENGHVVYVAQVPSSYSVRMFTEVGQRLLPHSTAVGKVLLAFRPREAAEEVIEQHGLPRRTPVTITDRASFLAELDTVAEQGYAVDNGEQEVGVRCLAVPVFGVADSLAAMSVSGPAARLERTERERILPEMLRLAAAAAASFMNGDTTRGR